MLLLVAIRVRNTINARRWEGCGIVILEQRKVLCLYILVDFQIRRISRLPSGVQVRSIVPIFQDGAVSHLWVVPWKIPCVLKFGWAYLMWCRLWIGDPLICLWVQVDVDERNRVHCGACQASVLRYPMAVSRLGALMELCVPDRVYDLAAHLREVLNLLLIAGRCLVEDLRKLASALSTALGALSPAFRIQILILLKEMSQVCIAASGSLTILGADFAKAWPELIVVFVTVRSSPSHGLCYGTLRLR